MTKLTKGKDIGLSLRQCIELMKGTVYQYKIAGQCIYEEGFYRRSRKLYGRVRDGGLNGAVDIYILTEEKEIKTLLYNTKRHRAQVAFDAWQFGETDSIDYSIWSNYITNGWNTRTGLFKSQKNLERIKEIERSHADYLGNETFDSTTDHENRVAMRKRN
jgi:hypothetical protein